MLVGVSRLITTRPENQRRLQKMLHPTNGSKLPGLLLVAPIAAFATIVGRLVPTIGAPVVAVVLGMIVSSVHPLPYSVQPGLRVSSRLVLQGSVVFLGATLSFREVLSTGLGSLPILVTSLIVALVAAQLIGRALGVKRDLRLLIGVGTAICGASAIAATDAVISASEAEVSYAISTIFTFNVIAVLSFPALGHLMHLSPHAFGLWAGTAINDVSSVVAASTIYGHGAATYAMVVKLTRTLAIIPISVAVGILRSRAHHDGPPVSSNTSAHMFTQLRRGFPVFIIWFLAAVLASTIKLIPASWHSSLTSTAQLLITFALAAIGLSTQARAIRRTGSKPLLLGATVWLAVLLTSLGLQLFTGAH
jgi:uncharacterized integral membrane protein (TIGR00698 family)